VYHNLIKATTETGKKNCQIYLQLLLQVDFSMAVSRKAELVLGERPETTNLVKSMFFASSFNEIIYYLYKFAFNILNIFFCFSQEALKYPYK
jgi:hypothetical protein